MARMSAWQAALRYHVEKGTVISGKPTTMSGHVVVNEGHIHYEGIVEIERHSLQVDRNSLTLDVPVGVAILYRGTTLGKLIEIPETPSAKINEGFNQTKIIGIHRRDEKMQFLLRGPQVEYERI